MIEFWEYHTFLYKTNNDCCFFFQQTCVYAAIQLPYALKLQGMFKNIRHNCEYLLPENNFPL